MQGEDRDRRVTRDFEKALAQHLRRDAAAVGGSVCLDAEMLAAYQERQLSADEMIAARDHLNSCLRCGEILAQLEATEHLHEMQVNELQVIKSGEIAAGAVPLLKDSKIAEAVSASTADVKKNAAVSTRKMIGPRVIGRQPRLFARLNSAGVKSPSGPTNIKTRAGLWPCSSRNWARISLRCRASGWREPIS